MLQIYIYPADVDRKYANADRSRIGPISSVLRLKMQFAYTQLYPKVRDCVIYFKYNAAQCI